MKLESIIKKISTFAASFVVYVIALGMYLSFKGFVMGPDGTITLVNQAQARQTQESLTQPIPANLNLPYGHTV